MAVTTQSLTHMVVLGWKNRYLADQFQTIERTIGCFTLCNIQSLEEQQIFKENGDSPALTEKISEFKPMIPSAF